MFEPRNEPARTFYWAFENEAKNRKDKDPAEWILAERMAVYNAALEFATDTGLEPLTLKEIEYAETYACGHCDYGATWAYRVVELLKRKNGK